MLILLLAGFAAYAEDENGNGHSFSFGVSLGMLSGTADENVYRSGVSANYLSQLAWHFNPVFFGGVDLNYGWQSKSAAPNVFAKIFSGFFFDAYFKYGLPGRSGLMEDRDWLMSYTDWVTHYSLHTNETEIAMLAGADIGRTFRLTDNLRLGGFLSYDFMYYSFAARGGIFLYPESDGGHFYDLNSEHVVLYEQFWHIFSPGLSFHGVFNRYFDTKLFFKATPLIVASSHDTHLSRDLEIINEYMLYGLYLEPGLVFTFKPVSKFALSLSLDYRNISGTRGNSIYKYTTGSTAYRNVGGASYASFDVGIAAKIVIGD